MKAIASYKYQKSVLIIIQTLKLSTICLIVLLCSCNMEQNTKNPESEASVIENDSTIEKSEALNNPALFYGSSFGNYFQSLYKLGKFDEMLIYTSTETREKYGDKYLTDIYSKLDFGFSLNLKSMSLDSATNIYNLNYEYTYNATLKIFRMRVKIENDTVKFVDCDLNGFPQ